MKNLTFIALLALTAGLMGSPAFGVEYGTDFLEPGNPGGVSGSLKTFDDEWTLETGETVDVDIWISELPEDMITAGFVVEYDDSRVSIANTAVYDGSRPGPWDGDMTTIVDDPAKPGILAVIVGNLSCIDPDASGDIAIARVIFECISPEDAQITVKPVSDFDTIVSCEGTVYDPQIALHTITIFQGGTGPSTTTTSPSTTTSAVITSSTTSSPSTTTTTIKRCLSESIYGGNAEETRLLRHFRDNVLSQTTEGRELINLYYLWSPVIVSAMEGNDEFRTWVKELIDDVLPVIQEAVE